MREHVLASIVVVPLHLPRWRMFWTVSASARRFVLGSLLLMHLTALALNSLPWSPLVAALYPAYGPYIRIFGISQGWSVYDYLLHDDIVEVVAGELADGTSIALPFPGQVPIGEAQRLRGYIEERDHNFLESITMEKYTEYRRTFGAHLCRRFKPEIPDLRAVSLTMVTTPILPLSQWKGVTPPTQYQRRELMRTDCSTVTL